LSLKTLRDFSIDMVVLYLNFNQSSLSLKTLRDFSIDMVVLYLNFNQSSLSLKTLRDFSIDMVLKLSLKDQILINFTKPNSYFSYVSDHCL
jgi:hypothetical protein